jgi:zinc protease
MTKLLRRMPFGRSERLVVSQHELDNGLAVLLLSDHVAPVVAYQTWLRVGSAYEDPEKTGLAHLFEHLMFNETENLPPGVFDRKLEELGVQNNAATWLDWTYYHELLPSEALSVVMELEAERLARLKVQEPQVNTEREVVANERRLRVDDDVTGAMSELLHSKAFTAHSYRWPTIGWMPHILGFTLADCQAFYRTYYAPNNATLVVVGDFDERSVLDSAERLYGPMPRRTVPPAPTVVEPEQQAEIRETIAWPMSAARLSFGYHAVSLGHPDHVALTALSEILFGGRSGRLRARLVDEDELASDVYGWVPPMRWPGLYEIHVALREGCRWQAAIDVVDREIARLVAEGPTAAEMEKAVARAERSFFDDLESADGKAEKLGFFHTTLDDFAKLFERVERLATVTADDVVRVAGAYLRPQCRTVVAAEPAPQGGGA